MSTIADLFGTGGYFFGVKPITIDPEVGERLAFILQDDSPDVEDLLRIEPFGLEVKHGIWKNMFGPVGWLLISMYQHDPASPICSVATCFNPQNEAELTPWRRLAGQPDWHLFVAAWPKKCRYLDFDNSSDNFNLARGLSMIIAEGSSTPMVDPAKAKALFKSQRSITDLRNMPQGQTTLHVHPSSVN